MKGIRRSTLIINILLAVMLLIALSTATYAWFASDNMVNLSSIYFTADTQMDVEGELTIGWLKDQTTHNAIQFYDGSSSDFYPMIPSIKPTKGLAYGEFLASFHYGFEQGGVYAYDGDRIDPFTLLNPWWDLEDEDLPTDSLGQSIDRMQNHFYLCNNNKNGISMDIRIEFKFRDNGDVYKDDDELYLLRDFLRIAVFVNDELDGIMATAPVYYGEIVGGERVSETESTSEVNYDNVTSTFVLEPGIENAAEVKLVAWFDGVHMKSVIADASVEGGYYDHMNKIAQVEKIIFHGTYINVEE